MKKNWIIIILCGAAVLATGPGVAAEELEAADSETRERFSVVIDAVRANPDMAVEITGELVRNFPESAPSIVVSAIQGLPEWDDALVDDIVAAARNAAPEEHAAIEAAAAEVREARHVQADVAEPAVAGNASSEEGAPEEAGTETADASDPDRSAEEGGDTDEELRDEPVRANLDEIELPERLVREVALLESLMEASPDRILSTVRRSIARVSDEEWFWSAVLVQAAVDKAPELMEPILAEAIATAPHHEVPIREAILGEVLAEVEAETDDEAETVEVVEVEEIEGDDTFSPRLQREIQLTRSLVRTFPENAPDAVRRSVGRVADEEAYWAVGIIRAASEEVPEQEKGLIEAGIAAAPHHEEEIRALLEREIDLDAEVVEEKIPEPFTITNASEVIELRDDRLTVRFDVLPTEPSRVRLAVQSLELSIRPERYFDPYQGRYMDRHMATVTGDGIVGLGFRVFPDDSEQIAALTDVMERFLRMAEGAGDFIAAETAAPDAGLLLGEIRTDIGKIYFYPSKRRFPAQFTGDFRDRTYGLRLGGAMSLTRETVPAIRHLLENLPRYRDEYHSRLKARERQLEAFHQFTQEPIRESAKEEEKEES